MNVQELWEELHASPELSMHEVHTMEILEDYIRNETDLELYVENGWLYAAHEEPDADKTIVIRAEMDAIPKPGGGVFHGCGHDGHAAMAAGTAAALKGRKVGKNVIFLFQPGEEIGAGAAICLPLFDRYKVDMILACHNLPGYELGSFVYTENTFACASEGLKMSFTGRQSHAAYPEDGLNPAGCAAKTISELLQIAASLESTKGCRLTIVNVQVGNPDFGINPGFGSVSVTIRAENDGILKDLEHKVLQIAESSADQDGLGFTYNIKDPFHATVNDAELAERLSAAGKTAACSWIHEEAPVVRWSEDFGLFSDKAKAFYWGIGSGTNQPGLHTEQYVFPEDLLEKGIRIWLEMIRIA
ncbi:MAG: amidohydrolase [Firmicutes bacterium]|nr:amidohydrolase [Bacillota bacterium]